MGGIAKLVLKMKGLVKTKAQEDLGAMRDLGSETGIHKQTGTEVDEAAVDKAKEEGELTVVSGEIARIFMLLYWRKRVSSRSSAGAVHLTFVCVSPQSKWNTSSRQSSPLSFNTASGIPKKWCSRNAP